MLFPLFGVLPNMYSNFWPEEVLLGLNLKTETTFFCTAEWLVMSLLTVTHSSDSGYILDDFGWFITSGEDYIFNPILVFNHIVTVNIILLYFRCTFTVSCIFTFEL